jgi:hypothetical protein
MQFPWRTVTAPSAWRASFPVSIITSFPDGRVKVDWNGCDNISGVCISGFSMEDAWNIFPEY